MSRITALVGTMAVGLVLSCTSEPPPSGTRSAAHVPATSGSLRLDSEQLLPTRGDIPVTIIKAELGIAFVLRNARPVAATRESKQTIRYRGAAEGSDVTYSLIPEGVEDRVYFTARPASERLVYEISLMHVSGLRKIRNVLEFLDSTGTPRLRVNPPFVVDRNGRHDATLEVYGCEVDEDPRPPWGRALRAPGSQHCELHVAWHGVEYPAMVDPEWVATAAPTLLLGYHSATLLRNGRVLITNTNGAADLFDPTTRTFAATGSMTKPFGSHLVTPIGIGPNAGKALSLIHI